MNQIAYSKSSATQYNSLHSVFEADAHARTNGALDVFLKEIAPVFVRAKLNAYVGVSLLHRHNLLSDGTIMLQALVGTHQEQELVSKPHPMNPDQDQDVFPILLGYAEGGGLIGFEYSKEPRIGGRLSGLLENDAFLEQFWQIADKHGLRATLGLSILTRDLFDDPSPELMPIEASRPEATENVIRLVSPRKIEPASTIETHWFFSPSSAVGCEMNCVYRCFDRSPGHSKEHAGRTHTNIA